MESKGKKMNSIEVLRPLEVLYTSNYLTLTTPTQIFEKFFVSVWMF